MFGHIGPLQMMLTVVVFAATQTRLRKIIRIAVATVLAASYAYWLPGF